MSEEKIKLRNLIEEMRKQEHERIRRFQKYLKEQANLSLTEEDAGLILDITEDFLENEEKERKKRN